MQPHDATPGLNFSERAAAATLIGIALTEDLGFEGDATCEAMIDADQTGRIDVVAREPGVLACGEVAGMVFSLLDPRVEWRQLLDDGVRLEAGDVAATACGPMASLLTGERTALNFLTHLSGVASLTRRFVDAVEGMHAVVMDTRKTLPGFRLLQKYAVRQGGGRNHRMGLYDGVMLKDNHLAAWGAQRPHASLANAVYYAQDGGPDRLSLDVEVDTLDQLRIVVAAQPDVVLLDNMPPDVLREAVAIRDEIDPGVLLEASGGVTLETVGEIARTGVDRISVGALTHSVPSLDLAFDWHIGESE